VTLVPAQNLRQTGHLRRLPQRYFPSPGLDGARSSKAHFAIPVVEAASASPSKGRLFFSPCYFETGAQRIWSFFKTHAEPLSLKAAACWPGAARRKGKKKRPREDLFPDRFLNATRKAVGQKECSREIKMRFFGRPLVRKGFPSGN